MSLDNKKKSTPKPLEAIKEAENDQENDDIASNVGEDVNLSFDSARKSQHDEQSHRELLDKQEKRESEHVVEMNKLGLSASADANGG